MQLLMRLSLVVLFFWVFFSNSSIAQDASTSFTTVPKRVPEEPKEKDAPFKVPATNWEKAPVLWGYACELADGTGLAFGGVDQITDAGNPHTKIKTNNEWVLILDELKKKNPLQDSSEKSLRIRNQIKDTLTSIRHLYFEGKPVEETEKLMDKDFLPKFKEIVSSLQKFQADLKSMAKLGQYEAGQIAFANTRLSKAIDILKALNSNLSAEMMANIRMAQIDLEFVTEYFNCEPAPRALSKPVYHAKSNSYFIFGGDHMDYLTNDLWVFDVKAGRWFQRHQETAPEERADHHFEVSPEGKLVMFGGYNYDNKGYRHRGPAKWVYDIEKNTWAAEGHSEKAVPSHTRSARYFAPSTPENYMKDPRPNAQIQNAALKALPENILTRLDIKYNLGGRDWSTWGFDFERDLFYVYGGGHASYSGNDVAHYHVNTNRWEINDVYESPLGCCGSNEQFPGGYNFNKRPWVRRHVWNSLAYCPELKQLMLMGSTTTALDPYFYLYDPASTNWVSRHKLPTGLDSNGERLNVRTTKHGLFCWYHEKAIWLFDHSKIEWKKIEPKGKMGQTVVDGCGMVYDSKRDRMLCFTLGGYAKPFDGLVYALDFKTQQVDLLSKDEIKPNPARPWNIFLREMVYLPNDDLVLFACQLEIGKERFNDLFVGYDTAKNIWVTVKLGLSAKGTNFGSVCQSIAFDAKRQLVWLGDASWNGGVWVLNFNAKTADIQPLKTKFE